MIVKILIFLIYFWHYFLGKFLGWFLGQRSFCRFYPSCSVYTAQALSKFGVVKGTKLALVRILKCQPFGKFGADFLE